MQKKINLQLLPAEAASEVIVKRYAARQLGIAEEDISGFYINRQSIDARGRQPMIQLSILAFIHEPFIKRAIARIEFRDVSTSRHSVIIAGTGPAGIFAALYCIENGIRPIVIERGKDVRNRRRDLALLNKEGVVNPESNYCFGEGGAGTYSDGKLYTRSTKRGNVERILQILVQFGANENILYEAHPHIGTNKLPQIIAAMRQQIIDSGGQVLFSKKLVDLIIEKNQCLGLTTADGDQIRADATILATGHSARDIFELLHARKIQIESKPFALGVRIEHPQQLIDAIQYHCPTRDNFLPPASYSLVQQVQDKGVFSFCMCPGGIIAPAATSPGELVVNGWSPSKRNNPFANSGIVVSVDFNDILQYCKEKREGEQELFDRIMKNQALAGMYFQQSVERKAFDLGGGKMVAPAQRMVDFAEKRFSASLPDCSYVPGIHSVQLQEVLPGFIFNSLASALREFGKKMKGYFTNEAVVVATESRSSSPVRIPRNGSTLEHPQIEHLFPCGEGAGYAGGIVSAAMDGEKVAARIVEKLKG